MSKDYNKERRYSFSCILQDFSPIIAKIASYLHGVSINSSSDTFAGIRNSLNDRRNAVVEVPSDDPKYPSVDKSVERNTCMVWDDIDSSVFGNSPDL